MICTFKLYAIRFHCNSLWDRYAMLREMEMKGLMIYDACITNTKSVFFLIKSRAF